jgi:hypothetical protein
VIAEVPQRARPGGEVESSRACLDASRADLLLEVVAVDFRDLDDAMGDAHAVVHHELGEAAAVDEDDSLDGAREVDGVMAEGRGGDEDALVGALSGEGAVEGLHVGAAHLVLPALGLYVDLLEAEAVERDDAVDPGVAGATAPSGQAASEALPCSAASLSRLAAPMVSSSMAQPLTAEDILPLVQKLAPDERLRLLRLITAASPERDALLYQQTPPGRDELSADEEPLAWDSAGWEDVE